MAYYIFYETNVPPGRGMTGSLGKELHEAGAGVASVRRDCYKPSRVVIRANDGDVVESVLKRDRFAKVRL